MMEGRPGPTTDVVLYVIATHSPFMRPVVTGFTKQAVVAVGLPSARMLENTGDNPRMVWIGTMAGP
jgi:hypothetical protein